MKEERSNISNEQMKYYIQEARVLRSHEVSRLTGEFLQVPIRLLYRFSAFKIASARAAVENL